MQTLTDETKQNTTILIDGIRFVRVQFVNCQLIYEAREEVDFQDCTFDRVEWTFADAAERMIGFLATVAKNGAGGKSFVEAIVRSIMTDEVSRVRTVRASAAVAVAEAPPATVATR